MTISKKLIDWQAKYGRNNLPWQKTSDAYCRWVAEIMLQQTQVKTVIGYYEKFLTRFPSVQALADAQEDEVLAAWAGMGYYSRARNLHKAAKKVANEFGGRFPMEVKLLSELPGVGESTAGAIISAVTDRPEAVFDANVKRVFSRLFAIEAVYGSSIFNKAVKEYAEKMLPKKHGASYSQALMDLGATVCVKNNPKCEICPLNDDCLAYKRKETGRFPIKPKKKEKRSEELYLLLYLKEDKVFVQKRPDSGIWAGLWSPPITKERPENAADIYSLKHELTHRSLTLNAMAVNEGSPSGAGKWLNVDELDSVGMPTPVSIILQNLLSDPLRVFLRLACGGE